MSGLLRGEDLARGKPALRAGKRIAPADLGLMASLGFAEVPVRRRLRVAFFSTGDELRSVGEPLAPGEVYDSNRYTIWGMLTRLGVEVIDMGVVRDEPESLERAVRIAAESVLPGNPVAVIITFYFFAREALLRMMGAEPEPLPFVRARSQTAFRKRPGRTEYQRARLIREADGTMSVRSIGSQGSGVLRSMSEANCIVVLHHGQESVAVGDEVDCIAFDGLL